MVCTENVTTQFTIIIVLPPQYNLLHFILEGNNNRPLSSVRLCFTRTLLIFVIFFLCIPEKKRMEMVGKNNNKKRIKYKNK